MNACNRRSSTSHNTTICRSLVVDNCKSPLFLIVFKPQSNHSIDMHRIFFVRPHILPHLHRAHGFEPFVLISVGSIFRPFLRAFDRLGTPGGHAAKPRRLVRNKENKRGLKIYEKRVTRGHDQRRRAR